MVHKSDLTPREQQVCGLLLKNLSNAEIASKLGIALETVKIHIKSLRAKTGLRSRVHLAIWWHSITVERPTPVVPPEIPAAVVYVLKSALRVAEKWYDQDTVPDEVKASLQG